jgi:hypothetical protein
MYGRHRHIIYSTTSIVFGVMLNALVKNKTENNFNNLVLQHFLRNKVVDTQTACSHINKEVQ